MAYSPHYVYGTIEDRFIKSGESVVKFGVDSIDAIDLNQFMIGMIIVKSTDIDDIKASLLGLAKSRFTPTSYGDDYFIGDRGDMLDMMQSIAKKYTPSREDLMAYAETLDD